MMSTRKTYDKAFKAKVAMEAIKGDKTIQELVQIYQLHHSVIGNWKKTLLDNIEIIFERSEKEPDEIKMYKEEKDILLQEVGQLQIENRFLKKSSSNFMATKRTY